MYERKLSGLGIEKGEISLSHRGYAEQGGCRSQRLVGAKEMKGRDGGLGRKIGPRGGSGIRAAAGNETVNPFHIKSVVARTKISFFPIFVETIQEKKRWTGR
jgi:hypothetical protein